MLAESVIHSDIDPFFEFPPQAYAVVGEGVPPFELFERGKYVTRTAPYDTADTSPDILPEFDLEGNHIVVVVLSFVVAAHTSRSTQLCFHRPRSVRRIEFAVQFGGYDTAFPYPMITVRREYRLPERFGVRPEKIRPPGSLQT